MVIARVGLGSVPMSPSNMQRPRNPFTTDPSAARDKLARVSIYSPPSEPMQETADPEKLFREGVHLLLHENLAFEAVNVLGRACRCRPNDMRYASYYGLSLALSRTRLKDAEDLCARAVKVEHRRADLYCNLGRVRLARNDKRGAYAAFKRGLSLDRNDARLRHEMIRFERRRTPVIGFLGRRHPLNKYLGKLRSLLMRALGMGKGR